MLNEEKVEIQQEACPTCPEGTVCEDSDLLCVNIPCTTTVVLLGLIRLDLGPICLRVGSIGGMSDATDEEKLEQVQQVVGVLRNAFPNFTA